MASRSTLRRAVLNLKMGTKDTCTATAAVSDDPRSCRRMYSATRRLHNYLPMVLETTPRGERAYDIYSRLLRVTKLHLYSLLFALNHIVNSVYPRIFVDPRVKLVDFARP